jgi:hypothetical protein
MAEIFSFIKPLSNLTGVSNTNGSFSIFPEQLSSLNFNGNTKKKEIKTKVSDIKPGQTVMVSEAYYESNSVFITKVESRNGFINNDPEQPVLKYYLYHLSEFSMEQPFTYNATYGDSYSGDTELYVIRDDIDNFIIGTDGWALTNNGNAIFSNIFARGRIEATSGKIEGNLEIGKNEIGLPLVEIGSDLFNGLPFESVSQKHSGILLDKNNYLLSYPSITTIGVSSIVITDSSTSGNLYSATFTLPLASGELNTLRVGDFIELSGFTDPKTTALNSVHQVTAVDTNTFTISVSYDIDLVSPVTINVSVKSFALNKIYNLTSMNLSSTLDTLNTSTVKIYSEDSNLFSVGSEINLESFTGELSSLNGKAKIINEGEGYITVTSRRILSGTYTSSLGSIVIYSKVQKFKVGSNLNYMSFSSETGSLQLTGTINAHSGNFINRVYVGQAATTFYIFKKKLLDNSAYLSTTEPHSFIVGDIINVSEIDSTFNGTHTITHTPSATSFRYAKTAANIAEVELEDFGYASSDSTVDGTIKVGVAENGISIDGTNDPETSAIYVGEGNFKNADTGFWIDASGRFSIGDQLYFEDGNLTISGTVTANAFAIDANNYWNTTGNEGDFRVGSATSYLFWNQTNSPNAGDGNLEVKGTINATAGIFSGNIQTTGKIYSGTLDGDGLLTSGIEVASTGIKGIIGGITAFNLPADGVTKPAITNFEILNAQVTGDKTNAFIVAGNVGVSADNITVRGYRGGTDATAAIYNTSGGTATTFASGTGFYFNDNGFFKVGTTTANAKFDPTANSGAGLFSVTGEIKATSGYIGGTNNGWLINSNRLTNDSGVYGAGLVATSAPILLRNLAQNPDVSYSLETNTYSGDITGYRSINRKIGTFLKRSGIPTPPFGNSVGAIIINGTPVRTSTFTGASGSNAITCSFDGETDTLYPGMFVYGTGIAPGAKINSISGKILFLSAVNTGVVSGTVTLLNPYTFTKTVTGTSGQSTITVSPNNYGIVTGMRVTGTGIATNATVSNIASNVITLSIPNTGAVSGTATFFTENNPLINHFGGFEFDTADVPYTFTAQNYVASAYFYVPAASTLAGRTITLSVDSGATWTDGTATPATLVAGSWVRASTIITMTASGAGAPNIVAKLSGASDTNTSFKDIFTANWMISEGNTLQNYFDENFPMGVNVGGYAIEYEKAFYSGSTFANNESASLQLGHGGNIYASSGKIGGLNIKSNQLYATNGSGGDFVVGDTSTTGDYPLYGIRINFSNYWNLEELRHEINYTNFIGGISSPIFTLSSNNAWIGDSSNPLSTVSDFQSLLSNGAGSVINLASVEDVDNGGSYKNISTISSSYYNTSGAKTGSTYMAQYDATSWILGPNVKIAGTIDAGGGTTPVGSIIMWSELTLPSGWIVCNGQSTAGYPLLAGTVGANVPDLRNRFIIGAGSSYAAKSTGGAANHTHANTASSNNTGSHSHGHNISVNAHNHSDTIVTAGANAQQTASGQSFAWSVSGATYRFHTHAINGSVSTNTPANQGGNISGNVSTDASHSHTITMSNADASTGLPPYYALYFIIYTGQPT